MKMSFSSKSYLVDNLGICTSILCIVHCAVFPIVLVLGVESSMLIDHHWLDLAFVSLSLLMAGFSFIKGYRVHRQHFVAVLFLAGFLLLLNGEAVHKGWQSVALSIAGAGVITYAHLQNLKWRRHASVA